MVHRGQPRDKDTVVYRAYSLCYGCHKLSSCDGTLIDYPRRHRRREDVVQDYREIRARYRTKKITKVQIAELMGMTYAALDRALCRARKDGVQI